MNIVKLRVYVGQYNFIAVCQMTWEFLSPNSNENILMKKSIVNENLVWLGIYHSILIL